MDKNVTGLVGVNNEGVSPAFICNVYFGFLQILLQMLRFRILVRIEKHVLL